jgi:ribonuclease P protein component
VLFFIPQKGVRKVGFTATKKIGNAVKRNKAKRKMRALFIEFSKLLKDGRYIFVAKNQINDVEFETLKKDFTKILSRANAIEK